MSICVFCPKNHQTFEECVWDKINKFVEDIHFYVDTLYNEELTKESTSHELQHQPSSLLSEFGQKVIKKFIAKDLFGFLLRLEIEFHKTSINYFTFDQKIFNIIMESNWKIEGHAVFLTTCAKVIMFGIFALKRGYSAKLYVTDKIRSIAQDAYNLHFLDPIYDSARRSALSVTNSIFKCTNMSLRYSLNEAELEIEEFKFVFPNSSEKIKDYVELRLLELRYFPYYHVLDSQKFRDLVKRKVEELIKEGHENSDPKIIYFQLVVYAAVTSIYSIQSGFTHGVQVGIDSIVELLISVKRFNSITSPSQRHTLVSQGLVNNYNEFSSVLSIINGNFF